MEVRPSDKLALENLIKALKKGKFSLEFDEMMALTQSAQRAYDLLKRVEEELNKPPKRKRK